MKSKQIINQAVEKLAPGIRENYVFGNIFLHDVISSSITDLRSAMKEHGILRFDNKMQVNNLENFIKSAFSRIRKEMGEEAYAYTPTILERFEEDFSKKLKVMFYTAKREYDRSKQSKSDVLAHLTMIYLISRFEIARTKWYAGELQKVAEIGMEPVYDLNIKAIESLSAVMIRNIQERTNISMQKAELEMAFEVFEKELNECKVEFKMKETA